MFILFDFVIHNPMHVETDTNLGLLDIAAGYYGRLQYATGGSFPSMLMSGFSHIATDFVRRTRAESGLSAPASEMVTRSAPIMSERIAPAPLPVDSTVPPFQHTANNNTNAAHNTGLPRGMPSGISPEPLFYPIEDGDPMVNDDFLGGLDFTNFFGSVIPEF
jgi:hypothetical protein